jgi:broad specificity phosphatase PhoE
MNNIWLIRHGESQSNAGEKTTTPEHIGLTTLGELQSQQIANTIIHQPDLVVYTPYVRTQQSSKPIIEKYPGVIHEEWPLQEFTYLNPHQYHNTSRHDRQSSKRIYWSKCDPYYSDGGGAESYYEFLNRIEICLNRLKTIDGFIIVYTHGHVISSILWYVLNWHLKHNYKNMQHYYNFRQALKIPNGAIIKMNLLGEEPEISPILINHIDR